MIKYFFLVILCLHVNAGFEWEQTDVVVEFEDEVPLVYDGGFLFKNNSDSIITIREVKASCGCTSVTLKKKKYRPGEGGIIPYRMNLKGRVGSFSKSIRIYTDYSLEPQKLTFTIKLPKQGEKNEGNLKEQSTVTVTKNIQRVDSGLVEQKSCPFQGTAIKRELYVDHRGKRIYTCCEECIPLVKAAPELAISRLYEMKEYPLSVERAEKKYPKTKISSN